MAKHFTEKLYIYCKKIENARVLYYVECNGQAVKALIEIQNESPKKVPPTQCVLWSVAGTQIDCLRRWSAGTGQAVSLPHFFASFGAAFASFGVAFAFGAVLAFTSAFAFGALS